MSDDKDRLILVGRVAGAFGVRGEVRISAYTADPMALLGFGTLLAGNGAPVLHLVAARPVKDGVVARVQALETKEAADALRGTRLFVPRASLPEPDEEEYYLADLIGLKAVSPEGAPMGVVKAVHDFHAGDILEIDPGQGRPSWMQPFTREAVPDVRIADGVVVLVKLPETVAEPGMRAKADLEAEGDEEA